VFPHPEKPWGNILILNIWDIAPNMAKCRFPILGRLYEKSRVSAYFRVTLLIFEVTPAGFCGGLGLLFV
jgi:hypothetical protein